MREPQPFFRKQTKSWYVQLNGKQVPLGKDKTAAFAKYHELMAKRKAGVVIANEAVCTLLNKYLAFCEANRAKATFEKNRFHLRRFAHHIGARLKVSALKPYHVQEWIDKDYAKKSSTYQHTAITAVKGALEWAAKLGYIEYSPIAKMPKPRPQVREEFIKPVDWQLVLDATNDQSFRDYLVFALLTGARPQEMRIIEARHLEPENRRIVLTISESKGRTRQRVIYLDDMSLGIVERLARENLEGPIFRNSQGNPWKKNSTKDRFKRMRVKLGIKGLCATVLRHSYAHYMLSQGVDDLVVSKLLGHVDGRMLATRYGHLERNELLMLQAATKRDNPLAAPVPAAGTDPDTDLGQKV